MIYQGINQPQLLDLGTDFDTTAHLAVALDRVTVFIKA